MCASKITRHGADGPPSAEARRTHVRYQSWVAATGRQLRMHREVYQAFPAAPDLAEQKLPVQTPSEQLCSGHSTAARLFRGPCLSKKQHAPRGELGSRGTANCLPCHLGCFSQYVSEISAIVTRNGANSESLQCFLSRECLR